ncbi:MAG TPA: hypothetical protein PLX23_00950 [Candidatus Hydrogenedens sp.]|nr:hypothetical protein [Candidatus Hydrogenedens sp.]
MKKCAILVVSIIMAGTSFAAGVPKLNANSYPNWFDTVILPPLLSQDKDNAVAPFMKELEGKKKSSKKDEAKKDKNEGEKSEKKKKEVKNAILLEMEGGRVAQIVDDTETSLNLLTSCINKFKAHEEKAAIDISKNATKGASVVAGEGINTYVEKPYEKIMMYMQQSMNYLAKNNLEDAMVDVRNANAEQKTAMERYQKEIEKVEKESNEKKVNYGDIVQKNYAGLDEMIGKVKNSFQNAYSFYICGVISECYGLRETKDFNDAYISYKDALEIYPENKYLQRDAIRLAKFLKMEEDYKDFTQRFPERAKEVESLKVNNDDGQIIVVYEDGLIPKLHQIDIPIPIPGIGLLTLSFPTYSKEDKEVLQPLEVSINSMNIKDNTEVICDLSAFAAKSLKERLPGMLAREIIRTGAMGVVQNQIGKRAGILGSIVATIADKELSKADLRALYSLPCYVQCFRSYISPGQQTISLSSPNFSSPLDINLEIKPGSITIVRVTRIKSTVYHKVFQI